MRVGPTTTDTVQSGRAEGLDDGQALSLRLLLVGLAFRLVVPHELGVRQAIGRAPAYARLQLISTTAVIVVAAVVPVGAADVTALLPVAFGYIAVQALCAAAVLLAPARRRPTDVEVVSP